MNTKLQRVNAGAVLVYAIAPLILAVIAAIAVSPPGNTTKDTQIAMFVLVLLAGYFVTFILLPQMFFSASVKKFKKFCNDSGCRFDYFFYGSTTYVAVDTERRTMGLLFKLNPTSPYVLSLDEVTDATFSNGVGPLTSGATSRVSFSFHVDGKVVTVFTFHAGTACKLETEPVQEAIKKAEKMVEVINA